MKRRRLTVAGIITFSLISAFALWKFVSWRDVSSKLSKISVSDLTPFQYYVLIFAFTAALIVAIWLALQIIPKRQARALRKPESPIVIGEQKLSIEGYTHTVQSSIKPQELFVIEN